MRIVLISDTHGLHQDIGANRRSYNGVSPPLPKGDMIIHSGDLGESKADTRNFLHWFAGLKDYRYKIFIAGNHDRYVEGAPDDFLSYSNHYRSITYLEDSSVEIEGLKIYGSPYTRNLPSWAFQVKDGEEAVKHWSKIPDDTDILVTHGPPYGILDEVINLRGRTDRSVGCKSLRERVEEVKPKLHVFGHIHEGRGTELRNGTTFINASMLDENYYFWPSEAFTFDI